MKNLKKIFRKMFPRTGYDFAYSAIAHQFFTNGVSGRVLLVGDLRLREYKTLAEWCDVYLLDIISNPGIPNNRYLQQSLETKLPFREEFDYVFLPEMIENTWNDRDSLLNVRSVLKRGGELRLSLQLYDDDPLHHHIYSPASVRLLVNHAGFEIISVKYHGLVPLLFRPLFISIVAIVFYPIFRSRSLEKITSWMVKLNDMCSSSWVVNKPFQPSIYITAVRADNPVDPIDKQKKFYERQKTDYFERIKNF